MSWYGKYTDGVEANLHGGTPGSSDINRSPTEDSCVGVESLRKSLDVVLGLRILLHPPPIL